MDKPQLWEREIHWLSEPHIYCRLRIGRDNDQPLSQRSDRLNVRPSPLQTTLTSIPTPNLTTTSGLDLSQSIIMSWFKAMLLASGPTWYGFARWKWSMALFWLYVKDIRKLMTCASSYSRLFRTRPRHHYLLYHPRVLFTSSSPNFLRNADKACPTFWTVSCCHHNMPVPSLSKTSSSSMMQILETRRVGSATTLPDNYLLFWASWPQFLRDL